MQLLIWVFFLIPVLSNAKSMTVAEIYSIASKDAIDMDKIALCPIISSPSNSIELDNLINNIEDKVPSSCLFIKSDSVDNILSFTSYSELGLVYMDGNEVLINPSNILANIAALIEANSNIDSNKNKSKNNQPLTLIVILDTSSSSLFKSSLKIKAAEVAAKQLIEDAITGSTIIRPIIKIIDYNVASIIDVINESVDNINTISGSQIKSIIGNTTPVFKSNTNKNSFSEITETQATIKCSKVVDAFLKSFDSENEALLKNTFPGFSVGAAELRGVIDNALEVLLKQIEIENIGEYKDTLAYINAAHRARLGLASIVLTYHRKLLLSAVASSKDTFNQKIRRVGAGRNFATTLKSLANAHINEFIASSIELQNDICTCFIETLTSPLLSCKKLGKMNLDSMLGYNAEMDSLSIYCYKATKERMDHLFLQGSYNPFVRTANFPPLHLNLNYLIDPRSIPFEFEHRRHYDVHSDTIATNRGDLLHVPNTATIPFSPNYLPQGDKDPSWWQKLQTYYEALLEDEK